MATAPTRTTGPATAQLELLDTATTSWRLDRHTRAIGRQGVARARAVLQSVGTSQAASNRRRAA